MEGLEPAMTILKVSIYLLLGSAGVSDRALRPTDLTDSLLGDGLPPFCLPTAALSASVLIMSHDSMRESRYFRRPTSESRLD